MVANWPCRNGLTDSRTSITTTSPISPPMRLRLNGVRRRRPVSEPNATRDTSDPPCRRVREQTRWSDQQHDDQDGQRGHRHELGSDVPTHEAEAHAEQKTPHDRTARAVESTEHCCHEAVDDDRV